MSETRHFLISGRVQGVGFRAATSDCARRLRLDGWVRNTPDGRVEVTTRGNAADVAVLREWLEHGPAAAHVVEVLEKSSEETDLPSPFSIE